MQVNADGTGQGVAGITAKSRTVGSTGDMGVGAFADGSKATITVNSGSITTTGPNGSAALAKAGGTVNLNGVAVSASGDDTRPPTFTGAGVGSENGGVLTINGGSIIVSGAGVWGVQEAWGGA